MGRSPKKCIICHVQTDPDVLKQYGGRCKSCGMVKMAADMGLSYRDLQVAEYEKKKKMHEKNRLAGRDDGERKNPASVNCRKCGGYIPVGGKYDGFCCWECKTAFEKQQLEAIERGAIPDPEKEKTKEPEPEAIIPPKRAEKKKPEKNTNCLNCGGPLRGRQTKYCSQECDYQYNRERLLEYMRGYQDSMRPESMKRANLRCKVCGGPITAKGRKTLCSKECAKKAKAIYK